MGEEGPHLAKRQINLILIPRLQSWTKSVKKFALSYSQETHPANLAPGRPLPPPLPGQCCLVGSKNVPATLQHCFFGGKWKVSWVNRALEGSILKLDLQGAFFVTFLSNILGSLPAQDGRPQGQVLVSYHLTEKYGNSGMRTVQSQQQRGNVFFLQIMRIFVRFFYSGHLHGEVLACFSRHV